MGDGPIISHERTRVRESLHRLRNRLQAVLSAAELNGDTRTINFARDSVAELHVLAAVVEGELQSRLGGAI
jgi:two-component sensor histidine kinase